MSLNRKLFEKKYNLRGQGKPVKISEKTRADVDALKKENELALERSEQWAKTCQQRFG